MNQYFPPGIQGPQVDTADPSDQPQGGIGMPASMLYRRGLWDSPSIQGGPPHNLPAPGDRLAPRTRNLVGTSGSGGSAPAVNPSLLPGTQLVRDRHRYANVVESVLPVSDAGSQQLLPQPVGLRNMLQFRNTSPGAQVIFISFGTAASLSSLVRLAPGQAVLYDTVVPQNEVNAVADTAGAVLAMGNAQFPPV